MSLRRLLAVLVAVSLFWGPLALQNGAAMAAAPTDHNAQMMMNGDCHGQSQQQPDKRSGKSCCIAMVTAIEAASSISLQTQLVSRLPKQPEPWQFVRHFSVELATPPPRAA